MLAFFFFFFATKTKKMKNEKNNIAKSFVFFLRFFFKCCFDIMAFFPLPVFFSVFPSKASDSWSQKTIDIFPRDINQPVLSDLAISHVSLVCAWVLLGGVVETPGRVHGCVNRRWYRRCADDRRTLLF